MKKKRWLSYFIVLAIALTMIPKPVSAEGKIIEKSLDDGDVVISSEGNYIISQNDPNTPTTNTITVDVTDAKDIYIILNGVNIDVSGTPDACAFKIKDDSKANVTVELAEGTTNTLKSGYFCAGLQKNGTVDDIGTLTITGTGTLEATGGTWGAGIGGGGSDNRGVNKITIESGKVIAKGGDYAAGIGGGFEGSGSSIKIENGTVEATGGTEGAGVGGGSIGSGSNITISGGTVTAIGGDENFDVINFQSRIGNGIGSGALNTSSGNIEITDGSVKAIGKTGVHGDKADDIGATPTNGEQTVYLAKLDNQDDINGVSVDGQPFKRQGNHPDNDTAFYLYLTGKDHTIVSGTNYYKATWNNSENNFVIKNKAPTPTVSIKETTASSITVNELPNQDIYGEMECSIDGNNWTTGNILTNLQSANFGGKYTVYARYKSNSNYLESDTGKVENVSTNSASYTISIPSTTLIAGNSNSTSTISVNKNNAFDLGYKGHVDVKVKNNGNEDVTNDAKLKLKRQGDSNTTVLSALLVNGTQLGDINNNVARFKSKDDSGVSISFAKPEGTIPAGTYQGTITFEVSYDE